MKGLIDGIVNNPTKRIASTKVMTTPTITAITVTPKAASHPVLK
jgi:hypothetical protein